MTAVYALAVVGLLMLMEQQRSLRNERVLRSQGAVEPSGDVYRTMAWMYPSSFVAMAVEGWWGGGAGPAVVAGVLILVAAKALKYWAIGTLGERWTFRVLVPPRSALVSSGPYAFLRHPNYVAVLLELAGFAVCVGALLTGTVALVAFGVLLYLRIRVEEKALAGT